MQDVSTSRFTPNLDRISTLSATILLAYSLSGLIRIPARQISTQLPGFYFEIQINFQTIVSFLVAALAASGTDWLLREHPNAKNQPLFQHLLIPALMAWVIGIPLYQQAGGIFWWIGLMLGGGALILVLVAEYIVVDPDDARYPLASIGLSVIAYTLFFLLAVTLRANQLRLFLIVPALTLAIALINLRILYLRLRRQWNLVPAALPTLIIAELTIVAHYLPLSPVAFGLFLLGPAYGLINLVSNLDYGKPWKPALSDTLIILCVFWGLAFWFR